MYFVIFLDASLMTRLLQSLQPALVKTWQLEISLVEKNEPTDKEREAVDHDHGLLRVEKNDVDAHHKEQDLEGGSDDSLHELADLSCVVVVEAKVSLRIRECALLHLSQHSGDH